MISSPPKWPSYKDAPIRGNWLKRWLKSRFRYVDYPFVLAYRGFGNTNKLLLQGYVFRGMALTRPRQRYSAWKNFIALIKMFLVRTVPESRVMLEINGKQHYTTTDADGKFEFEVDHDLQVGWHRLYLKLDEDLVEGQEMVHVKPEVLIKDHFKIGLISDIDDTFLVSHVTKIWRKLYVLLTKNAQTRKPFRGVVKFYQLLHNEEYEKDNPFFYVSSSEWNLYDFLINFCRFHHLPKGVLQLKDLKDHWMDFFKSGFGSHEHKRHKIERIFRMYPGQKFILLGDNGQHDPYIYLQLTEHFSNNIEAVYIRGVKRSHRQQAEEVLAKIRSRGIDALQFKHSSEAMEHARKRGYIQ